jgi:hypothetical protein
MIKSLAITVAGVAAAAALAFGLVAAGFGPQAAAPGPAAGTQLAAAALTVPATAEPTVAPEIVYVKPAPSPRTVVVERQTANRSTSTIGGGTQVRPVRAIRGEGRSERDDGEEHEWGDD